MEITRTSCRSHGHHAYHTDIMHIPRTSCRSHCRPQGHHADHTDIIQVTPTSCRSHRHHACHMDIMEITRTSRRSHGHMFIKLTLSAILEGRHGITQALRHDACPGHWGPVLRSHYFLTEATLRNWWYNAHTSLKEASFTCLCLENKIYPPEQIVRMLLLCPDLPVIPLVSPHRAVFF